MRQAAGGGHAHPGGLANCTAETTLENLQVVQQQPMQHFANSYHVFPYENGHAVATSSHLDLARGVVRTPYGCHAPAGPLRSGSVGHLPRSGSAGCGGSSDDGFVVPVNNRVVSGPWAVRPSAGGSFHQEQCPHFNKYSNTHIRSGGVDNGGVGEDDLSSPAVTAS